MLNLRLNYPSVKAEADIFQQYVKGLPEQEKYALLAPKSFTPDEAALKIIGQWLQLPPETLQYQSDVITTCSGNSAVHCILSWFTNTEHTAGIEEFTYNSFKLSAQELGYQLHTITCDEEGILPDHLERHLRTSNTRLLYLQPTLHNPTCSIMSLQRRKDIAAVVKKFKDVYIIEDDAYRFLHPAPPPSFLQLIPERTIYICSLSKTFNPFVRTAYIIYPKRLLQGIDSIIRYTTSGSSSLFTAFAVYLMQGDLLHRVIAEKRQVGVQLHAAVAEIFNGLYYKMFPGSYHIWLKLPPHLNAGAFTAAMKARKIAVMSSEEFSIHGNQDYIRIALGDAWASPELLPALQTIADATRRR